MLLSLQCVSQVPKHLEIALQYENVTEVKKNSSPEIDTFLKYVGLSPGNPYCAAFVSFCIGTADVLLPKIKSGLARKFITKQSIPASKVLTGEITIPAGSITIWQNGNTIYGHTGFVLESWKGPKGKTIEANTNSYLFSSDGEGIYINERNIKPGNAFRITYFTLVEYE